MSDRLRTAGTTSPSLYYGTELAPQDLDGKNKQESSSLSPQPQTLSLSEFLPALFESFTEEGLRPCVLRNYEGFPVHNVGGDIDFLIRPSELPRAIRALRSLHNIRVVGYSQSHWVAHAHLEGISPAPEVRSLALDFIWSLNWKGLEYLSTESVLQAAMPRHAGGLTFLVPSPVHEAIISLLSSLLVGGWLNEKYFTKLQQSFADDSLKVTAALSASFENGVAKRLVASVIDGDRQRILSCVRPLRVSLARRSLLHRPLRSVLSVARYYMREFGVRCTPATLESVCILGCDGRARTTIIESLIPMLRNSATTVERYQFGPQLFTMQASIGNAIAESDTEDRSTSLVPLATIFKRIAGEWIGQFKKRNNLTLRIGTSSYYDLLFDSQEHRLRMPSLFARVVGHLLPAIDLLIVLDETEQGMQLGSHQAPFAEGAGRNETRPDFAKVRDRRVIPKACGPSPSVVEEVYAEIIDMLAQRTKSKLKSHFESP
jgi:hypothetical protein